MLHYLRLERLATDKYTTLLDPFVSYEENEVLWIWPQGLYSQPFILFLTYEWDQKARVLHYIKVERLATDKYTTLLDPFISYKENEVLWIRPQGLYSQPFILFLIYKWDPKARVVHYTKVERRASDKHSAFGLI